MRRSRSYRQNGPGKAILGILLIAALGVGVFFGVRAIIGGGAPKPTPEPEPTDLAVVTPSPSPTPSPTPAVTPEPEAVYGDVDVHRMEIAVNTVENIITVSQRVTWTNRTEETLDEVLFRLYPNVMNNGENTPIANLSDVFPNGLSGAEGIELMSVAVDGTNAQYSIDGKLGTTLRIKLAEAAAPLDTRAVSFEWSLKLLKGFYPLSYSATGIQCAWFYPIPASYANGSWSLTDVVQTFGYYPWYYPAADYDVVLRVDSANTLMTTGEVTEKVETDTETTYYISARNVRDFAFCITDLEKTATERAGAEGGVTVISRAQYNDRAQSLAKSAKAMINFYEELLGPCPVSELEICQVTLTGKPSVHHGLILFDSALFTGKQSDVDIALAKAVARQWLGESVGSGYADDKDLHTPLCEYLAYLYLHSIDSTSATAAFDLAGARLMDGIRSSIGTSRFDPALLNYCTEYAGQKGSAEAFAALCGDSETDVLKALGRR